VGASAAAAIVLASQVAIAAPDPEAFVVEAERALAEERYAEAAEGFEKAYRTLSARERTGPLGEHLVLSAAEAREQAWLASDRVDELEAASSLLTKHVAVAEVRKQTVSPEVVQTKQRIEGLLARLRRGDEPRGAEDDGDPLPPVADPPAVLEDDSVVDAPRPAAPRRRPDGVAIGLLAGGSVAVVGGATMLGVGAALPGWARNKLEERGGTGDGDAAFLADADRLSVGLMAAGGTLAGLGVVAIVVGAVRAVRGRGEDATSGSSGHDGADARRRDRALAGPRAGWHWAPQITAGSVGIGLRGRW
jgi:hypothetical protein